ncbi:PDZ domain-containing protein [Streptomyces sp. Ncost-T10-10d]|uniref:PDZ domain-containing protein n=1 Tax=Streptomyces sp. Ncost-T10-10d TaxID=1839774 RepID=UPI00081E7015|nr:PDZ domain-containing protein [Streptomyces sp. Ncost-T10-10d]SCF85823.1 Right handed beta helix region [Streptomyces sp. Ncost-T10-10d]
MRTVPGSRSRRRSPASALTAVVATAALGAGLAVLPAGPAAAGSRGDEAVTFHVSPHGDDRAKGSAAKPFRTLERAQEAVRTSLRKGVRERRPVDVVVHGGTYRLRSTLEFTAADSGTAKAPVRYVAAPGEHVVLSGGRALAPRWRSYSGTVKVADIGAGLDFDGLFLDGQRQTLARYPDHDPSTTILGGYAADAISAQRVARWKNPTTALVRGLHDGMWGGNSFKVTGVKADGTPELAWVGDNNRGSGLHSTYRMVENVFEELDAPGEWFYDKPAGKLYFYPPAGVDPAGARVETAEQNELIRVAGKGPDDAVRHLTLSGFTFTQTHRTLFNTPYEKLQLGDWALARAAAVHLKNTENVSVRDSHFDQLGGNALLVDGYNNHDVVSGNEFSHSGASDVAVIGNPDAVREPSTWDSMRRTISDTRPGPKTENYPRDISVRDNYMHDNGQFEKQTSGVQISMSRRVTVDGNTIHDGPRACVDINDGTWGGHLIENNDIFNCVKETSDHGPFNSWGRDRFWPLSADDATKKSYAKLDAMETTVIRHNRIRHSSHWDIDLDDGSSNYLIEDNLLLNGGVKLREGFHRTVRNNVFVNGGAHFHVWFADSGDVVEKNVFVTDTPYSLIQVDMARSKPVINDNLFWNDGGAVQGLNDAWRANGLDTRSVIADPKFAGASPFADPAKLDYTVQPDSPALALGFHNIAMDGFGKAGSPTPPPLTWPTEAPDTDTLDALPEPLLGVPVTRIYSDAIKSATGLTDTDGLHLASVPSTSEAYRQGLRANDVIREIDGRPVTDRDSFWLAYNQTAPGADVTLKVWRNQSSAQVTLRKPTGVQQINNTSGVVYTGTGWDWKNRFRGGAGGWADDVHATQGKGDSFELAFNGTAIDLITQVNTDEGEVELFIDGRSVGTIDNYNATRVHQKTVFSRTGLAPGVHTLRGVMKTGDYLIVDSFRIQ